MTISDQIRSAGVVGAGGGGFPTYVKANSKVEFVLANGAECEPLIHKDYEIMVHYPEPIAKGMKLMMESVSAKKGYLGIKEKNKKAIDAVKPFLKNAAIEMTELGDFYPAGDEYELVYLATGRLIPAGGIPLNVGCVVNNVETFYNVYNASKGIPLTQKFLCVTGAVKKPSAFFAPIGTSFRDLITHAGGTTVDDFGIYIGGTMMGALSLNPDDVVTKTTAGLIVLPKDHMLIRRKNQPEQNWHRIGKSACDQCSYCTEFCPRYLLGYDVQPHKVMRTLGFTTGGASMWNNLAELCCACGLCTLYSCPEDLFPKEACDRAKAAMRKEGVKYTQKFQVKVHPMKESRRVPIKQLVKRLQLQKYDVHTPFTDKCPQPSKVTIFLKQHIGEKAQPVVTVGEKVSRDQLIAEVPKDKLGAPIHASICGTVEQITEHSVTIKT